MQPCAQVLLTQDNLGIRSQYLNARNTFTELFAYGTVPIVNENDTVAVEQVRFGDNDTLAAQVNVKESSVCSQRVSISADAHLGLLHKPAELTWHPAATCCVYRWRHLCRQTGCSC